MPTMPDFTEMLRGAFGRGRKRRTSKPAADFSTAATRLMPPEGLGGVSSNTDNAALNGAVGSVTPRADSEGAPQGAGRWTNSADEKALCSLVAERVRACTQTRRDQEIIWQEALMTYRGRAWGRWVNGAWESTKEAGASPYRVYPNHPKVKVAARKLITRAMSAKVSYTVKANSDMPQFVEAAKQARSIAAHMEWVCNDAQMLAESAKEVISYQPCVAYDTWDSTRRVPHPVMGQDMDGSPVVVGIEEQPVGEVSSVLLPLSDVMIDPRAKREEDARWGIIRQRMPLAEIRSRWPGVGDRVVPDMVYSSDPSGSERTGNSVTGHSANGGQIYAEMNTAAVFTMWEKPGPDFPDNGPDDPGGRYVVVANNVILEEPRAWPYGYMRGKGGKIEFPFTVLHYEMPIGTTLSDPAIAVAVDMQRQRDRLVAKVINDARRTPKILAHSLTMLKPGAFKSEQPDEIVTWGDATMGTVQTPEPKYLPPLPIDPATLQALELVDADIDSALEVGDVDRGQTPYAGAPYAAIEALQQQSASASTIFNELRRQWCETRMRKRLALCRQFYGAERMLFLSDRQEDEESESAGEVVNLSEFFSCGVQVMATLASPELPAQRIQRFLEMAQAGMFSPEQLPITLALIKGMNLEGADVLTEDLIEALSIVSQQAQQKAEHEAQMQAEATKSAEAEKRTTVLQSAEVDTQNTVAIEAAKVVFQFSPDAAMQYLTQQGMEEQEARQALGLSVAPMQESSMPMPAPAIPQAPMMPEPPMVADEFSQGEEYGDEYDDGSYQGYDDVPPHPDYR